MHQFYQSLNYSSFFSVPVNCRQNYLFQEAHVFSSIAILCFSKVLQHEQIIPSNTYMNNLIYSHNAGAILGILL